MKWHYERHISYTSIYDVFCPGIYGSCIDYGAANRLMAVEYQVGQCIHLILFLLLQWDKASIELHPYVAFNLIKLNKIQTSLMKLCKSTKQYGQLLNGQSETNKRQFPTSFPKSKL
jgi:hypothetical protein